MVYMVYRFGLSMFLKFIMWPNKYTEDSYEENSKTIINSFSCEYLHGTIAAWPTG